MSRINSKLKAKKNNRKTTRKQTSKIDPKAHLTIKRVKANRSRKTNKIGTIFNFPLIGREKKNFSTSFEYGNFFVDAKSKGGDVNINFNVANKSFKFSGNLILSEKTFSQLQRVANHILSNAR